MKRHLHHATRQKVIAEKAAAEWNRLHPETGLKVYVEQDDGSILETVTESAAWVMGGHSAVILVQRIRGGYSLDRVTSIRL